MMNNKGQTLVLFVVILPILLLLLVLVIDVGKVITLKLELNNISDIVLEYGMDNLDNENLKEEIIRLVNLNKKDIDKVDITVTGDKIYVYFKENCEGLFASVINMNLFTVETNYVGYIENDKKRIERIGD